MRQGKTIPVLLTGRVEQKHITTGENPMNKPGLVTFDDS